MITILGRVDSGKDKPSTFRQFSGPWWREDAAEDQARRITGRYRLHAQGVDLRKPHEANERPWSPVECPLCIAYRMVCRGG